MLRIGAVTSVVVTVVGSLVLYDPRYYRWIGDQTGYSPVQPIEFSHKVHAKDNSVACEYCHFSARRGPVAGIPPVNVCMNCHSQVKGGSPEAQAEIQKVLSASQSHRPIRWARIHRLPDFVRFDHSAHVTKGVTCQTCHGPVETMARVEQTRHLSMGWCVQCHRQYTTHPPRGMTGVRASVECAVCHY